jgi:hypothetical protein
VGWKLKSLGNRCCNNTRAIGDLTQAFYRLTGNHLNVAPKIVNDSTLSLLTLFFVGANVNEETSFH